MGVESGVMSGIGAKREGEAAKDAAKFNARLALRAGYEEEARVRQESRRLAGENVTRVAKSGVRLEGSPVEVLANNAAKAERQALNARNAGILQRDLLKAQAKEFQRAADIGASTGALGGAGRGVSSAFSFGLFGGGGGAAGKAAGGTKLNPGLAGQVSRSAGSSAAAARTRAANIGPASGVRFSGNPF